MPHTTKMKKRRQENGLMDEANDGGDREKKREKKRERMKGESRDEEGSNEE